MLKITEQTFTYKDRSFKAIQPGDDHARTTKESLAHQKKVSAYANIVLVKRNEINEWSERYKKLKYDLALTRRRVTMKLEECRKRFER